MSAASLYTPAEIEMPYVVMEKIGALDFRDYT
jgi:hypothetical protein